MSDSDIVKHLSFTKPDKFRSHIQDTKCRVPVGVIKNVKKMSAAGAIVPSWVARILSLF